MHQYQLSDMCSNSVDEVKSLEVGNQKNETDKVLWYFFMKLYV